MPKQSLLILNLDESKTLGVDAYFIHDRCAGFENHIGSPCEGGQASTREGMIERVLAFGHNSDASHSSEVARIRKAGHWALVTALAQRGHELHVIDRTVSS